MGPVFGATKKFEPQFDVLQSNDVDEFDLLRSNLFEVRLYKPCFAAEIPCGDNADEVAESLVRYVEGSGFPQCSQRRKIISPSSQIVVTPPALADDCDLQYILPSHFTRIDEIPTPQNKDIVIRQIPERAVAVLKFSGINSRERSHRKLLKLRDLLLREGLLAQQRSDLAPDDPEHTLNWSVAEYHPYVTLPFLRRNEVWVELPREHNPALQRLLDSHRDVGALGQDQEDRGDGEDGEEGQEMKEGEKDKGEQQMDAPAVKDKDA